VRHYSEDFDILSSRIGENNITGCAFYWDPSSGRHNRDGSVCALIYRYDKNRNVFVHDIMYMVVDDEDMHPLTNQCMAVLDFMQKHNLTRIGIETNGIGNALPEIMRDIAHKNQRSINIIQISNHVKKETRILNALEPLLSTGHLYMHEGIKQTMLLSEMLAFTPMGSKEHDDGLDALAGAVSMMPIPVRTPNKQMHQIRAITDFQI
jgi:predicted phage terminase large subunit-like protein